MTYWKIFNPKCCYVRNNISKVTVSGNIVYDNVRYALNGTFSWVALKCLKLQNLTVIPSDLNKVDTISFVKAVSKSK